MINILPTEIKQQRRFGRLNQFLFRQLVGLVGIGLLAVGFMLSGLQLISNDETVIQESIQTKEAEYAELKIYEDEAKSLNEQIKTIEDLFAREVKLSTLLTDIASAIPVGARLTSLSLTGSRIEPLSLTATIRTQADAAVLRKSLIDSGVFEEADIVSITPGDVDDAGNPINYSTTITANITGAAEEAARIQAEKAAADAAAQAAAEAAAEEGGGAQ